MLLLVAALSRHRSVEDPASTVFDDEETVQDSEGGAWHGEEVRGRNGFAVIVQESRPALAGVVGRRQVPKIAGDGAFGDAEVVFQKLTVNSRSAPRGILIQHPTDERSDLGIDPRPAQALWPRAQAPEQPKASALPGDNGFWFNDDQDLAPCRPKVPEQNPKYSILVSQPRARNPSFKYAQLLTKGKDLETEAVTGTEERVLRQVRKPMKNGIMDLDL
jgi:hypothetical protein